MLQKQMGTKNMKLSISRASQPLQQLKMWSSHTCFLIPQTKLGIPPKKTEKETRELTILWNFSLVQWLWPIQLGTLDFHCSWCIGFKKEVTKTSYNTIKKHKKTILIIFSPFLTQHTVWIFTSIWKFWNFVGKIVH